MQAIHTVPGTLGMSLKVSGNPHVAPQRSAVYSESWIHDLCLMSANLA